MNAIPLAGEPVFAALDLGTNNCRLLVGTSTNGSFRVVDSFSRVVRLGAGLHDTGELGAAAMHRTLAALHVCANRLRRRPVQRTRAVATEACRRATNGAAFLADVKEQTGLTVDVISAREEAELAVESCASLLRVSGRRALLFDIGGGSTELAWVRLDPAQPPGLIGYVSLPIGVVNLAERFGAAAFTASGYDAMVHDAMQRLLPFEQIHCIAHEQRVGGVRLLGTSGTATTLAAIALRLPRYQRSLIDGAILSATEAGSALRALRALGPDGLALHPCVGPERVEFTLPGCAVFEAICRMWPAGEITVADRGLREGMLLRMMRHHAQRGSRVATAPVAGHAGPA